MNRVVVRTMAVFVVVIAVFAIGVAADGDLRDGYVNLNNGNVSITPSEMVYAVAQFGSTEPNAVVYMAEIECFVSDNMDINPKPWDPSSGGIENLQVWWPLEEAQARNVTDLEAAELDGLVSGVEWQKINYEPEFDIRGGQNYNTQIPVRFSDTESKGQTGYVACIYSQKASEFDEGEGIIDSALMTITTR